MKRTYLMMAVLLLPFCQSQSFAQAKDSTKFSFGGYVDAYYAYYTDSLAPNAYQRFPTISPRSNQFGLNTAVFTMAYNDTAKVRGVFSLHFGDIAHSAWSSDFNEIMEANVGIRLCKKLWLDGGFFRTHLGTESLLPKENIASSLAVGTFYEPFYESGFRLNYVPNAKWIINLYALNGYNRFVDNNDKKSFGALITYAFGDKGNIGYSNYIGDDGAQGDTVNHTFFHQNLFVNYQIKKLKIQAGVDYCTKQHADLGDPSKSASVLSGLATFKYQFRKRCAAYVRGEFFDDAMAVMDTVFVDKNGYLTGFQLWGVTCGVEYKPTEASYIRLEARNLEMDDAQEIFHWKNDPEDSRLEVMMNLGISF